MGTISLAPGRAAEAMFFVSKNIAAAYVRATPYILFMCLFAVLSNLPDTRAYTRDGEFIATKLVAPFLFAIFAVSWHRYSALETEQKWYRFPIRLGIREIKFASISIFITIAGWVLHSVLSAWLPYGIAELFFLLICVPFIAIAFFLYPAVALDQHSDIGKFCQEGLSLMTSLVIAFLLIALAVGVVGIAATILLNITYSIFGIELGLGLKVILTHVVLSPIFFAVSISTATFIYRDVIGIETITES